MPGKGSFPPRAISLGIQLRGGDGQRNLRPGAGEEGELLLFFWVEVGSGERGDFRLVD